MDIAALSLVVAAIFVWGIISTRQAVISTPNLLRRRRPHPGRGPQAGRPPARSPCDEGHSRGHACLGAIRRRQPRTILRPARRSALLHPAPCHRFAADDRIGNGRGRHHPGSQPVVCAACGRRAGPDRRSSWLGGHVGSAGSLSSAADTHVESGLNDGIATPIVTVALAAIAAQVGLATRASAWLDRFGLGRTDGRGAGCIRWHAAAFYWSARFGFGRVRGPIRAGTRTSPWAHGIAGSAGVVMIIGGAFQALEGSRAS